MLYKERLQNNNAELEGILDTVNSLPDAGGGNSEDLEALGVLCDWQITTNSDSVPIITIINYHPSYYLHCDIESTMDGELYHIVIAPDDSDSYTDIYTLTYGEQIDIMNVRWKASAE